MSPITSQTTSPTIMSANYNAAEIAQQRQKVFENELKLKQTDFEKFNTKPTPAKIDFADKLDSPLGSEMDKILAEQIALREKQLNMVLETQDKNAASKWLQAGQSTIMTDTASAIDKTNLKIGENINVDVQRFISPLPNPRKKVDFAEPISENITTNDSSNFFAHLLKKNPDNSATVDLPPFSGDNLAATVDNRAIKDMLGEILNKQDQILSLLMSKENNSKN
jgi:hypothetical protein